MATFSSFGSALVRFSTAPFSAYNRLLDRHPLGTKALTSGVMYAGGDVIAQYGETYSINLKRIANGESPVTTCLDRKRIAVFFIYGTCIGGPAYHYWFNSLNELPQLLWRLKQTRQRGQILRAYALLKSHNIDVKLDMSKLPKAAPLSKWKSKAAKIAADQLFFSSTYTLVFFFAIGLLTGAADRIEVMYMVQNEPIDLQIKETEGELGKSEVLVAQLREALQRQAITNKAHREALVRHANGGDDSDSAFDQEQVMEEATNQEISKDQQLVLMHFDSLIRKIREAQLIKARNLSRSEIWAQTVTHARSVYLDTYIADCIVWPPLQLINFTFVPVRLQFLFVNFANLAWNTFLSFMANKKPH